ncbi:MAG: hypothetical protein JRE40_14180, partial [Deltaproteobacteria bacterium]|nr:hypothetical protein [Deltaproteobacteria bacterium]
QGWLADWAIWDDFKLVQPNADGFTIVKRTNAAKAFGFLRGEGSVHSAESGH